MSTLPIPVTVWQANLQMYTFHILTASSDRDNSTIGITPPSRFV